MLRTFPSLSNFQHQIVSFDLIIIQVFECFLGPIFFKCLKTPLMHWRVSLPIFNGGISLICIKTIVPTTYLGNWALVAHVIVSRLLLNSRPFLLEVIRVNSLGSLSLSVFEIVLEASSPGCINIFSPILTTCSKGSKSIPRNYFKEFTQPFHFQHHF